MDDPEVKFCSNCKHEVPAANFMMHHIHCQRKLALCQKCDEPIPHSEFATHNLQLHVLTPCPDCGQQMEKMLVAEHQRSSCSHRTICCAFCHIEVEAKELMDHENYCGSRTERCEECGEFVMLKYQQLHQDSNHGFLKLEDEPGPTPLWSASRTTPSVLNDLSRQRKVSNASQDTTRPTSALNRLSPSKRTNDMPQVNSASTVSKPKALHKTTIPQGNIYEDDSVDLDLLLALRLEEQENGGVSVPPSAPPVGEFVEAEDLGAELVALPCEFCEAMIPANQLVIHETGCRPDLAQYTPHNTTKTKNILEPGDDGLPCEFCGELFAPHHLLQHEAACEIATALGGESMETEVTQSHQRKSKKIMNMEPPTRVLLPQWDYDNMDSSDKNSQPVRNAYISNTTAGRHLNLLDRGASVRKPTANVMPLSTDQSSSLGYSSGANSQSHVDMTTPCVNGYMRQAGSTGAVPKQKAGKHSSIREVSQEVPRSTSTSVTMSAFRPGLDGSNSSR